jgi:hypothetical protein
MGERMAELSEKQVAVILNLIDFGWQHGAVRSPADARALEELRVAVLPRKGEGKPAQEVRG